MYKIESAEEFDLEEIHLLDKDIYGKNAYPFFVFRQFFDMNPSGFLVARHYLSSMNYRSVRLYGSLVAYLYCSNGLDAMWILSICVAEEHRKKRLAFGLLSKAIESIGSKEVLLTVQKDNFSALSLYKKMGFLSIRLVKDHFRDGKDRLLMRKDILVESV